jgi:hypothetical protein
MAFLSDSIMKFATNFDNVEKQQQEVDHDLQMLEDEQIELGKKLANALQQATNSNLKFETLTTNQTELE